MWAQKGKNSYLWCPFDNGKKFFTSSFCFWHWTEIRKPFSRSGHFELFMPKFMVSLLIFLNFSSPKCEKIHSLYAWSDLTNNLRVNAMANQITGVMWLIDEVFIGQWFWLAQQLKLPWVSPKWGFLQSTSHRLWRIVFIDCNDNTRPNWSRRQIAWVERVNQSAVSIIKVILKSKGRNIFGQLGHSKSSIYHFLT